MKFTTVPHLPLEKINDEVIYHTINNICTGYYNYYYNVFISESFSQSSLTLSKF